MIDIKSSTRLYNETKGELDYAINDVYTSGTVIDGKYCQLVEEKLKKLTGRKYAKLVSSGTASLMVSLLANNLKNKTIACTNYSYVASVNQAALINNVDLFDVDKNGLINIPYNISHDAVIPVSLYGNTIDYDNFFTKITNNTKVIVDCAQSLGTKYKGKYDGAYGDTAIFSFSQTKPIPCAGTHGAIVWDDDNLTEQIKLTSNNGKLGRDTPIVNYGINAVPYEIQACQIYINLNYLNKWQHKREQISKYYIDQFKNLPLKFIESNDYCESNHHKFIIILDNKNALHDFLKNNNINTAKHYTDNFNDFFGKDKNKKMPNTEYLCNSTLGLPNHQWLTDAEVETVAETLKKFF